MNHLNRGGSAETGRRKSMIKVIFYQVFVQQTKKTLDFVNVMILIIGQ